MNFARKTYPQEFINKVYDFAIQIKKQNYWIRDYQMFELIDLHCEIYKIHIIYSEYECEYQLIYMFRDIIKFVKKFTPYAKILAQYKATGILPSKID